MKDNFSSHATSYARYRPKYPDSLFKYIVGLLPTKDLAWDCGTGNGQSAFALSNYCKEIYATDISKTQIDEAPQKVNITYAVEPAENTTLPDNSVDLITVAQALHWFHFEDFYNEVRRVAKPGALFAAWTYNLLTVSPAIDEMIKHYHYSILEDYWDEERRYVDDGYESVPFPFTAIAAPEFFIEVNWEPDQLEGYLTTWSATQKYIRTNHINPLPALMASIKTAWDPTGTMKMIFPIYMKVGYVQ